MASLRRRGSNCVGLAAVLALLLLRYETLVFLGVDPGGSVGADLPLRLLQRLLTLVTAFTVVGAMPAVGVVLVIGLMGAPAQLALLRSAQLGLVVSDDDFGLALHPAESLPPGPLIGVLCVGLLPLGSGARGALVLGLSLARPCCS